MMECRGRLDCEFVGVGRGLGRGWAEVVAVVEPPRKLEVGGCVYGGLHVIRGNERREIEFRRGRGRRGLPRNLDVYEMLVNVIQVR